VSQQAARWIARSRAPRHATQRVLASPVPAVTPSHAVLAPCLRGSCIPAGTESYRCPGAPRAVPGAWRSRRNAGCKGQRAGGIAGSRPPAAQAGEHRGHRKAASSPPLRQVHLHSKSLDLISITSARMKPSSRRPGWSSSPSPARGLHVLQGDEKPHSGQPNRQPVLQRCESTKRGRGGGCPAAAERVCGAPSPDRAAFPPGPRADVPPPPTQTLSFGEGHSGEMARSRIARPLGKQEAEPGCPRGRVPTSPCLLMATHPPVCG